jgi:hypothetical protein
MPALKVRRASQVHLRGIRDLSYVPIPIFNFLDDNPRDMDNCGYADE